MTAMERLQELLDRQDIFDAIKRISRGIDRFDRELFLSGYHADAVIDAGSMVGAPDRVYESGRALHEAGQNWTLHHLTNHVCDLDGDGAHCETYFLYVGRNRDGANWTAGGRYADRMERRYGAWRVAFRQTIIEWSGFIREATVPLFDDMGDAALNGVPARDRTDPSYRRPHVNHRAIRYPDDPAALGTVER